MRRFFVRLDAYFSQVLFQSHHDGIRFRRLDQANIGICNVMRTRLIKSSDDFSILCAERDLGFIAVAPWMLHAFYRMHRYLRQFADTGDGIAHQFLFEGHLAFIRQMLNLAASARVEDRTRGFNTEWGCLFYFNELRKAIRF